MKKLFSKLWTKTKKILQWIWTQLKDKTNLIIFIICFIVLSSEVWVPYLLGIIFHNGWLIGIGSACWAFWLGPFTPFLPLCIACTLGVRKIYDRIKAKREWRKDMKMKFKSTTKQPKALLYKRFVGLERSINLTTIYKTEDEALWTFDHETLTFSKIAKAFVPSASNVVLVENFNTILQYKSTYFRYTGLAWETLDTLPEDITLLSASFNNISRYQTNKYYYVGCFDFMVKGSIEGTHTQYIKGNIIPLTSLNIKHFDDDINIGQDDLVVIDGHLYSVENPETVIKYNPKAYNIYFATLNSIL